MQRFLLAAILLLLCLIWFLSSCSTDYKEDVLDASGHSDAACLIKDVQEEKKESQPSMSVAFYYSYNNVDYTFSSVENSLPDIAIVCLHRCFWVECEQNPSLKCVLGCLIENHCLE